MQATPHTPVAVIACPACEVELTFEAHPVHDWKRGTVTLEIILSEEASVHLASHFGGEPVTQDTDVADGLAPGGGPEPDPASVEPAAVSDDLPPGAAATEPVLELSEGASTVHLSKAKSKAKTA